MLFQHKLYCEYFGHKGLWSGFCAMCSWWWRLPSRGIRRGKKQSKSTWIVTSGSKKPYISSIFQQKVSSLHQQFARRHWLNIHVTSTGWSVGVSVSNRELWLVCQSNPMHQHVCVKTPAVVTVKTSLVCEPPGYLSNLFKCKATQLKKKSLIRPAGPKCVNLSWNFAKDIWRAVVQIHKYTFISGAVSAWLSFWAADITEEHSNKILPGRVCFLREETAALPRQK